jgi:hypothetical protein
VEQIIEKEFESVERFDRMEMETSFETTAEGFLQGSAVVTRTGVFTYLNPDGTYRYELRHPDDVFVPESLETIKRKPVTNDHPTDGIITKKNAKKFVVGSTGSEVKTDDNKIAIDFVVMDEKTIENIKNGKRELSLGYRCDTFPEEGVYEGFKYTHRQKNIVVNHLAVVQKGRAGSVARIRLDGALAPINIENAKENGMEDTTIFKTINLDSVDYQAEAKVIEVLKDNEAKALASQVKLDEAIAEKTKAEAERDSLKESLAQVQAQMDELKKVHVDSADVQRMVRERVALESFATKVGVEFKADQADIEIMKAVVQKQFPNAPVERLDDAVYLKARYDVAVESVVVESEADQQVRSINGVKVDAQEEIKDSFEAKRKAYVERTRKAHLAGSAE